MSERADPVVIDLGRVSRKRADELEAGGGELALDVAEVMAQVRAELGEEAAAYALVPVVIVYKRKDKKAGKSGLRLVDLFR